MAIIEPILTVLGPQPHLVRPARLRPAAHRQPLPQQRPAQHLPHRRRLLARGLHLRPVDRRAGDAAGRPPGADRRAVVRAPARAGPRTPTCWTRRSATGSPRAPATEVLAAFEKAEAAVAPVHDIRDVMADPQYRALDTITEVDGPRAGPAADAERPLPALRDPRRHPLGGPPARRGHRRGPDRTRPDRRRDRPPCARRARCDRPSGHPAHPPLTWLYVPGDRPDVVAKALPPAPTSVIVDLEDAVAPDRKEYARARHRRTPRRPAEPVPVHVRVNALDGPLAATDLAALAALPGLAGLRLPKVTARARSSASRRRDAGGRRRPPPVRAAGIGPRHRARLRHRHRAPRPARHRPRRGGPTRRPRRTRRRGPGLAPLPRRGRRPGGGAAASRPVGPPRHPRPGRAWPPPAPTAAPSASSAARRSTRASSRSSSGPTCPRREEVEAAETIVKAATAEQGAAGPAGRHGSSTRRWWRQRSARCPGPPQLTAEGRPENRGRALRPSMIGLPADRSARLGRRRFASSSASAAFVDVVGLGVGALPSAVLEAVGVCRPSSRPRRRPRPPRAAGSTTSSRPGRFFADTTMYVHREQEHDHRGPVVQPQAQDVVGVVDPHVLDPGPAHAVRGDVQRERPPVARA